MKRQMIAALFVGALAILQPTAAYASCSGFVDCLLGFTERTEVRNARMIEVERIQADRDRQLADIEAQEAERIRQADAAVEQVKQQQFATEAQRDIAIAEAHAKAEQYKAMIAGLTERTTADIKASADTQIASLQETTKIAIAGITETGSTVRSRLAWGWSFAIVLVLAVAGVVAMALYRRTEPGQGSTVVLLAGADEIDGYRRLMQRGELQQHDRTNSIIKVRE